MNYIAPFDIEILKALQDDGYLPDEAEKEFELMKRYSQKMDQYFTIVISQKGN